MMFYVNFMETTKQKICSRYTNDKKKGIKTSHSKKLPMSELNKRRTKEKVLGHESNQKRRLKIS
jgi:hypothetical protein